MANFTPQEIEEMLREFFDVVGKRQYIGARYVPIFGRKGEDSIIWNNSAPYEPLTIVLYQGNSYTSRQYVPEGVDISNTEFWAITGNYNAQVEQYRQEVINFKDDMTDIVNDYKDDTDAAIESYAESINNKMFKFATVNAMQQSTQLFNGAIARTIGFHSANDNGGAYYQITNSGTVDDITTFACGTLFAHLVYTHSMCPEQFGAYGNGVNDDYDAINSAFQHSDIVTFDGSKTYLVGVTRTKTLLATHVTVDGNGATIKLINTNSDTYNIITANNSIINTLKIIGDRDENQSTTGEWGIGIYINGNNAIINGCIISKCWGDGIYISDAATNVDVTNCEIFECRRQGISVIDAIDLTIENCYIHDINGTSPQAAIDFESNRATEGYINCRVRNCVLYGDGNASFVIANHKSHLNNTVVVEDCIMGNVGVYFDVNHMSNGEVVDTPIVVDFDNNYYFKNCIINKTNDGVTAFRIINDCERTNVYVDGCEFNAQDTNTSDESEGSVLAPYPVWYRGTTPSTNVIADIKNVFFSNCICNGPFRNFWRPRNGIFMNYDKCSAYGMTFNFKPTEQNYLGSMKYLSITDKTNTPDNDGTAYDIATATTLIAGTNWTANHQYVIVPAGTGRKTVRNVSEYNAVFGRTNVPNNWKVCIDGVIYDNDTALPSDVNLTIPPNGCRTFYCDATTKTYYPL